MYDLKGYSAGVIFSRHLPLLLSAVGTTLQSVACLYDIVGRSLTPLPFVSTELSINYELRSIQVN